MFWIIAAYLYLTVLFGLYYHLEEMKRTWTKSDINANLPMPFCAFLLSVVTSWWYWPIMVVYMVKQAKEEDEKKLEAFRRS